MLLRGLNVFLASRRFSQSDNRVFIVWGLLQHLKGLFACIGEAPYGQITSGEPYSILIVLGSQLVRLHKERSGTQR